MTERQAGRRPVVTDPTRIMVVVGTTERRGDLTRWLDSKPDLAVVAAYRGAGVAISNLDWIAVDVVVVDPETAIEDFAELALLASRRPDLPVLILRTDGLAGAFVERFGCRGEGSADAAVQRFAVMADEMAAIMRPTAPQATAALRGTGVSYLH